MNSQSDAGAAAGLVFKVKRLEAERERLMELVANPHPIMVPFPPDQPRLERIATAAMQGILSGEIANTAATLARQSDVEEEVLVAKMAAIYAKALIAELDEEQDQ